LKYKIKWKSPDVYLFTANNVIKTNGALVMGAGAAKEVRDAWKGVDLLLGEKIARFCGGDYGLISATINKHQVIAAFQTKRQYNQPAIYDVVRKSTKALDKFARKFPQLVFHLNYPAIGLGKLDQSRIYDIIKVLPDNVLIYDAVS